MPCSESECDNRSRIVSEATAFMTFLVSPAFKMLPLKSEISVEFEANYTETKKKYINMAIAVFSICL